MSAPTAKIALSETPLGQAARGLDLCVHCGFCMQACPTYLALGDEADSPRGRLVLMRGLVEGDIALDDQATSTHIDRCLGCRACETVCPSGVPYGHLLEATRATLPSSRSLPIVARLILAIFARPWMLRVFGLGSRILRATGVAALMAKLPGRLGFAGAMLASSTPRFARAGYQIPVPTGPTVALLHGCVMEELFAHTNRATERTLEVHSYSLVNAPGQRCCGALHAHAGQLEAARELARKNIAAFEASGATLIAVNASGCGAAMKEYGHLLSGDASWAARAARFSERVRDISELLDSAPPRLTPATPAGVTSVTYDAPCHLVHVQRVVDSPLRLLQSIPGVALLPLADADQCCGSAGIYNLIEPDTSDAVLSPKIANIHATGAACVTTGNPGCLMQIGAGLLRSGSHTVAVHPIDLLDRSYAESKVQV